MYNTNMGSERAGTVGGRSSLDLDLFGRPTKSTVSRRFLPPGESAKRTLRIQREPIRQDSQALACKTVASENTGPVDVIWVSEPTDAVSEMVPTGISGGKAVRVFVGCVNGVYFVRVEPSKEI